MPPDPDGAAAGSDAATGGLAGEPSLKTESRNPCKRSCSNGSGVPAAELPGGDAGGDAGGELPWSALTGAAPPPAV